MSEKHLSDCMNPEWLASGVDPVLAEFIQSGTEPSLDAIRKLFPPPTGEPAFDPTVIKSNLERLVTVPEVDTGLPGRATLVYSDLNTLARLSPYTDRSHSHTQPNGVTVTW